MYMYMYNIYRSILNLIHFSLSSCSRNICDFSRLARYRDDRAGLSAPAGPASLSSRALNPRDEVWSGSMVV